MPDRPPADVTTQLLLDAAVSYSGHAYPTIHHCHYRCRCHRHHHRRRLMFLPPPPDEAELPPLSYFATPHLRVCVTQLSDVSHPPPSVLESYQAIPPHPFFSDGAV